VVADGFISSLGLMGVALGMPSDKPTCIVAMMSGHNIILSFSLLWLVRCGLRVLV
jgi:hypothetical protein